MTVSEVYQLRRVLRGTMQREFSHWQRTDTRVTVDELVGLYDEVFGHLDAIIAALMTLARESN